MPVDVKLPELGKELGVAIPSQSASGIEVDIQKKPPIKIELQVKKTLDGNILILDHDDIDIVLMPAQSKCLTIAKDLMDDGVYGAQDRLFRLMTQSGVVDPTSVRSSNIYGSLEGKVLESKLDGVDSTQAALYVIHEYIKQEIPHFKTSREVDEDELDHLIRPDSEYSTELGQVPQSDKKGSMDARVRPYGYIYNYSLLRENEKEDS